VKFNIVLLPRDHQSDLSWVIIGSLCLWLILISGCQPDQDPFKAENQRLKKHIAKEESMITSLQEGNKVMQQQIDHVNQEARAKETVLTQKINDAEEKLRRLSETGQTATSQITALQEKNRKLLQDINWLRSQREQFRKSLTIYQKATSHEPVPFPFSKVIQVIEESLSRNGYAILASMGTDQKAVYVTTRKISLPLSLERAGFRNQYVVEVEKTSSGASQVGVHADFEKLTDHGTILQAGNDELKEIESRLLRDIQQILHQKRGKKKSQKGKQK